MWRPTTPDNCRWSWRTAWRFCRRFYASPFPPVPTGPAYVYYFCEIINLIGRHRLLHRRIQRVIEPSTTTTTTTIIHATTEVHFSFLRLLYFSCSLLYSLFSYFLIYFPAPAFYFFRFFSFFWDKAKKRRFARIEVREIAPIEDWRKLWFKVVQNWHCLKAMG